MGFFAKKILSSIERLFLCWVKPEDPATNKGCNEVYEEVFQEHEQFLRESAKQWPIGSLQGFPGVIIVVGHFIDSFLQEKNLTPLELDYIALLLDKSNRNSMEPVP